MWLLLKKACFADFLLNKIYIFLCYYTNEIMISQINDILRSIGLNKNEVKIFLDLIKKNSSSALEISKRTEIHRSNVYDSLRVLMEKGFVGELTGNKKKIFQALDPLRIK